MNVELPHHLRDAVNAMPEHSYGVTRVVITLRNGREVRDVYIGWGIDVLKVGNSRDIGFCAEGVMSVGHQGDR